MDLDGFREDPKTIAPVERKLLLISEAALRLEDDAERLCPGLPWRNLRGIGNWLRHRDDRGDVETGWKTVSAGLPPLRGTKPSRAPGQEGPVSRASYLFNGGSSASRPGGRCWSTAFIMKPALKYSPMIIMSCTVR